jgi:D-galactarolactone cycloisomerase
MYFTEGPGLAQRLADEAAGYVERGFRYVKMKVGMGVAADARNVAAVRDAVGPDIGLMADANYAYNVVDALRVGRMLERHGVLWFEEPVPPEDIDGYCELRAALDIPIAGGEAEFTRYGARELIARRAVDILQPDCCAGGGLTEARRMADLAHLHNIPCMPHVWGTNIGMAASLHFAATIAPTPPSLYAQGPLFEIDSTPHPLREAITEDDFPVVEGRVTVPDRPGLGVTLDRGAVDLLRKGAIR